MSESRKNYSIKPNPRFVGLFIPVEILEMDLTSTECMLLAWIDALKCEEHGGCYASNEYFCKKLHLKENTVKILISKLVDMGLVERVSFDGRQRIIRACKEKWFIKKSQSTSEVDFNQPQTLKKINPCGGLESTPPNIYREKEYIKEQQQGVVVFHNCIKDRTDLTEADKLSLMKFPPARVFLALAFAEIHPPTTTLIQELIWHCKQEIPPLPDLYKTKQDPEVNKSRAEDYERNFQSNSHRIDILSKGVEFVNLAPSGLSTMLNYNELGFKAKLEDLIKKFKFKQKKQ